jgi:adenylate cyclase
VFPAAQAEPWPCQACEAALRAAEDAAAANRVLNESRALRNEPGLGLDVALHFGEVIYGNVGASRRLDFTVMGPAVNETCRMEALCSAIGRDIVLSEGFVGRCSRPAVAIGDFALRGMVGPRTIYTLHERT